jgi:hypothetical protein
LKRKAPVITLSGQRGQVRSVSPEVLVNDAVGSASVLSVDFGIPAPRDGVAFALLGAHPPQWSRLERAGTLNEADRRSLEQSVDWSEGLAQIVLLDVFVDPSSKVRHALLLLGREGDDRGQKIHLAHQSEDGEWKVDNSWRTSLTASLRAVAILHSLSGQQRVVVVGSCRGSHVPALFVTDPSQGEASAWVLFCNI